jgi:hypothetical protein
MKQALEPETIVASQAVGSMGVFAYGQDGSPTTPKARHVQHFPTLRRKHPKTRK